MSENKYIIDKDSLTGIADAVRDKLGTGEATTDPQTGDIVYPEDKGYYLKEGLIAKFNMGDRQIDGSSYSEESVTYLTVGSASDSTGYNVYFQRPFYSATLSFTHYGATSRIHSLSVNGVSVDINAGGTKEFTFLTPQSYLIIKSDMKSAYGTDTVIYQNLTVTLFDKEGNNIGVKTTSIASCNFLTGIVPERIPYSIDDIRNKIVNLSEGGLKIFKCYNNSSISRSEGDGWKVSNYLGLSGYFDLSFSSTSPYITMQVPDLNPENIIYMRYIGRKQSSDSTYTRSFVFDPTLKDVEHYTSASISNGKRLSSTTDYYFFPDGAGSWSDSNDYGIMGMWDATNKILDLGLQEVSSRSRTYVASNYTTQYYNIPVRLIIVYKT